MSIEFTPLTRAGNPEPLAESAPTVDGPPTAVVVTVAVEPPGLFLAFFFFLFFLLLPRCCQGPSSAATCFGVTGPSGGRSPVVTGIPPPPGTNLPGTAVGLVMTGFPSTATA